MVPQQQPLPLQDAKQHVRELPIEVAGFEEHLADLVDHLKEFFGILIDGKHAFDDL